jgi:alkanesulfonate monooxygenase SsuD/methylene tetrahydromethanopterin reductase-like flavin-dependent oxidoreductase (luciferase family)
MSWSGATEVSQGPPLVGIVAPGSREGVQEAERMGIDSLWVGGHLASRNPSPEPMVWLARLAEQSERALIGTATLVLPWYQPPMAAKQLADIDRSCGGRLMVGVGTGGEYQDDFVAADVPIEERGPRLDESIPLLRRFWSAEPVEHVGQHFRYDGLRIHPAPTQPTGPPIIVTGRKRAAMRRAVQLGDGWMPYLCSPERYARSVATIRELADATGRSLDSFHWMAYLMVSVDDNPQKAQERAAAFLGQTYSQDFSEFIDRVSVTGPFDQVVEGLARFVHAGARHLVLLPCRDATGRRADSLPPWLPDLVKAVRVAGTSARPVRDA